MPEDEEVKQHFDLNSADYDRWMGSASHGMMHYGDHSQYDRNIKEKLLSLTGLFSLNEIQKSVVHRVEALAEKADIQEGDVVVDSGCGRGGNTIWLANNTDAEKVIGLDIDRDLIDKAKENAEEAGVGEMTEFVEGDFDNLPVEDFDVYFAIESQCYSQDEKQLVEQIFQNMNPGGRLVISDGFRTENFSEEDIEITDKMHKGWGVDYMAYRNNFERFLRQAGFKNIQVEPLMSKIAPTSRYLHRASVLTTPYVDLRLLIAETRLKASKLLGIEKDHYRHSAKRYQQLRDLLTTGRYQYIAGKKGVFDQYDFYAEKPRQ